MNSDLFIKDYDLTSLKLISPQKQDFWMWVTPRFLEHYRQKTYEEYTADLVKNYCLRTDVFIDVGAHYGFYSLLVGQSNPNCKIIAFEPVPENFEILKRNITQNAQENVYLHNTAVSSRSEQKDFFISLASDNSSFYPHPAVETLRTIPVQSVALDHYREELSGKRVVVKIDTEGNELQVLAGMLDIINEVIDLRLFVEFNPTCLKQAGEAPETLLKELYSLGFDVFLIDDRQRRAFKLPSDSIDQWNNYVDEDSYINLYCIKNEKALNLCVFSHSSQFAGAELSLLELVKELIQDYGVVNTVVFPDQGPIIDKFLEVGAAVWIVPSFWWCDVNQKPEFEEIWQQYEVSFSALLDIQDDLFKINPDAVLTNTMVIPWGAVASALLNVPHMWAIHEYGELDHHLKFHFPFSEVIEYIVDSSQRITVNSNSVKDALFGLSKDTSGTQKLVTIPYHIALRDVEKTGKPVFQRSDAVKLIITSRVVEQKGQLDAVLAVNELVHSRGKNVELLIIGAGDPLYLQTLNEVVQQNNLEDYVQFKQFQEEVASSVREADVVLVCSRMEAFGRVTQEAMLLKKPVIGTNTGGTPELIHDGYNGYTYTPGNYLELADKIESLIVDEDTRIKFGMNAYQYVVDHFTKENFGGRTYQELIAIKKDHKKDRVSSTWFLKELFNNRLQEKERAFNRELQEKERAFNRELQEKERAFNRELQEKERAFNRELQELQMKADSLTMAANEKDNAIEALSAKLWEIYGSTGWKLIQVLWRIRLLLAPSGSWRERLGRAVISRGRSLFLRWKN